MKICLDTNAFSKLDAKVGRLIKAVESAEIVYVPVIVLGELFFGFKGGSREKMNKQRLEDFLEEFNVKVVFVTKETAEIYAQIRFKLEKIGKPIPSNDIWIAAQAIETGSVLITYDDHFKHIPGLRIWGE